MTGRLARPATAGLALAALVAVASACTSTPTPAAFHDTGVPLGSFRLAAFSSCEDALRGLRAAAKEVVGPYGFFGDRMYATMEKGAAMDAAGGAPGAVPGPAGGAAPNVAAPDRAAGAPQAGTDYSGTTTQEAGIDEPDLVKTDGRRIVTISGGILRVVDADSRRRVGQLSLSGDGQFQYLPADLLLSGDHALVLVNVGYGGPMATTDGGVAVPDAVAPGKPAPGGPAPVDPAPVDPNTTVDPKAPPTRAGAPGQPVPVDPLLGPRLLLVDLTGDTPRILSTYTIDGSLVDARLIGATARIVVRSAPRVRFPDTQPGASDAARTTANKAAIDAAGVDAWLPRFAVSTGGSTRTGRVDCANLQRPATYSGTSMVTVLTMDLSRDSLGDGLPVTIVADADTVYATATSLYLANDQRWRVQPMFDRAGPGNLTATVPDQNTELYKFDIRGTGRPAYVASGSVPGWLVNRYALGEWNGDLRVASTTGQMWNASAPTSSAVYVLRQNGRSLGVIGQVGGLGKGERIYSVRFAGPIGYVVTFRQTDPLYTVDLKDPAHPKVAGELKLTGYSAYLHPVGDTRLIGIGQAADTAGHVQGTQVSLFDVSDPAAPKLLSRHEVRYGNSEAEFDPHAFLYWAADGLLVVPMNTLYDKGGAPATSGDASGSTTSGAPDQPYLPRGGALVLHVSDSQITEVGSLTHPWSGDYQHTGQIRRSLVIGRTLWTVSDAGLAANDTASLAAQQWLGF